MFGLEKSTTTRAGCTSGGSGPFCDTSRQLSHNAYQRMYLSASSLSKSERSRSSVLHRVLHHAVPDKIHRCTRSYDDSRTAKSHWITLTMFAILSLMNAERRRMFIKPPGATEELWTNVLGRRAFNMAFAATIGLEGPSGVPCRINVARTKSNVSL